MRTLLAIAFCLTLTGCNDAALAIAAGALSGLDPSMSSSASLGECEDKSWTVTIDGLMKFCHQDFSCNVSCF